MALVVNNYRHVLLASFVGILMAMFCSAAFAAQSFENYQNRIQQAVSALDTLALVDENESPEAYLARTSETLQRVRSVVPETEDIDQKGTLVTVDNKWLHEELIGFEKLTAPERTERLARVIERLRAIDERLLEAQKAAASNLTKGDANARLREILARPEYLTKKSEASAFTRLAQRFLEWFRGLFPKPKMTSGSAPWISVVVQYVVILIALAVIGYVIKLLLPRLIKPGRRKAKEKREPRIVLGETLAPDQSANDLLNEAESLARKGDLRAAIRKAYIALLVELGERKVISLAQNKTNRDYLRALREIQPLYLNVKVLTDSFERHWYGFAGASESDWIAFRAGYQNALK